MRTNGVYVCLRTSACLLNQRTNARARKNWWRIWNAPWFWRSVNTWTVKTCIDYIIFMTTWGTWRTIWKMVNYSYKTMMIATAMTLWRCLVTSDDGPQPRCQVPMEKIKKRAVCTGKLYTMSEERTMPLTQTPPHPPQEPWMSVSPPLSSEKNIGVAGHA